MKDQFIPCELALELKDLGFDEPCFGFYVNNKAKAENTFSWFLLQYGLNIKC